MLGLSVVALAPPVPMHASPADMPSLRRPSQSYVDSYIARRGEPTPASRPAPSSSALATPAEGAQTRGKHAPRIFYALERDCPKQYYPEMHVVSPRTLRLFRALLLVLCVVQLGLALAMIYLVSATHFLHDALNELFTEAVAALCAFAACAGFVGVCVSSRALLLFFYINQLWSLANISTFAVLHLTSADQSSAACRLYESGELSHQQLADRGLDCAALARTSLYLGWGVGLLVAQLWSSCFLSKRYSEMLQDKENDDQDRALVNFIWQRRGETWTKLEKFEDVVQRQFEELRMSLVAHAHHTARDGPKLGAMRELVHSTPQPTPQSPPPS